MGQLPRLAVTGKREVMTRLRKVEASVALRLAVLLLRDGHEVPDAEEAEGPDKTEPNKMEQKIHF